MNIRHDRPTSMLRKIRPFSVLQHQAQFGLNPALLIRPCQLVFEDAISGKWLLVMNDICKELVYLSWVYLWLLLLSATCTLFVSGPMQVLMLTKAWTC